MLCRREPISINVNDYGNYANRFESKKFLMAKSMDVKLSSFAQLGRIVSYLPKEGIRGFNISAVDNSDMARYNREGLKSALDAARAKAEFIAANEGLTICGVLEIIETTPDRYSMPVFSNVAYDGGSGMDNMRRIVRTYSVKVYFIPICTAKLILFSELFNAKPNKDFLFFIK